MARWDPVSIGGKREERAGIRLPRERASWKQREDRGFQSGDDKRAGIQLPSQKGERWGGLTDQRDPASIIKEGSSQQATSGRIPASRGGTNERTRERERGFGEVGRGKSRREGRFQLQCGETEHANNVYISPLSLWVFSQFRFGYEREE